MKIKCFQRLRLNSSDVYNTTTSVINLNMLNNKIDWHYKHFIYTERHVFQ